MTFDSVNPGNSHSTSVQPEGRRTSRGLSKAWKRGAIALLSLSILGAGGFVAYRQFAAAPAANSRTITLPVERRDLSISISANGTVKPTREVNVSPKNSGVLERLVVKEGDRVQAGQIIAYMDDTNLQGQLLQAKANLASAVANLAKVQTGNRPEDIAQAQAKLRSAQANLRQAEDTYRRNQSLATEGAITQQSLSQYKTDRDTAEAQVMEMQQALALSQAGSRQEDIDQAQAQVAASQGALRTIQAELDDTVIRAPFSGLVSKKYADPGAFVTPTTAGSSVSSATSSSILSLASTNQVVGAVAENNISKVRLGQSVTIKADAYSGKTFQGTVMEIAPQATVEQNVTSFEIKVTLIDPNQQLRSGMNVSMEFNVGQLKNAIVVPTAAVVRQQNVTGVFVASNNSQPVFTRITTGATVSNRTEVKSGLTGNERVLLSLPEGMKLPSGNRGGFPGFPGSSRSGTRSGGQSSNSAPGNGSGGGSGGTMAPPAGAPPAP